MAREGLSQEVSFGQRPGKGTPGEGMAWIRVGGGKSREPYFYTLVVVFKR